MALVQGVSSVIFDKFLAQFPVPEQPEYRGTDLFSLNGGMGTQGWNDLIWDFAADCVYPQPILVWHDNIFTGGPSATGNWPTVAWGTLTTTGALSAQGALTNPHKFYEVQAGYTSMTQPPSTTFQAETTLDPVCQGFTFNFSVGAEQVNQTTPTQFSITFNIGTDTDDSPVWYQLVFPVGAPPFVLKSTDDAATFPEKLGTVAALSRKETLSRPFNVNVEQVHVEVRYIASTLEITVGDMIQPWIYRDVIRQGLTTGPICWSINNVDVAAVNVDQIRFSLHPMKFIKAIPRPGKAKIISGQQSLGFVPVNDPGFTIHYAPDQDWQPIRDKLNDTTGFHPPGCSVSAAVDTNLTAGAILVYDLSFSNAASTSGFTSYQGIDFSDFTSTVRNVSYHFASVERTTLSTFQFLSPDEIEVEWMFDFNSLQIRSSARLGFNNFGGGAAAYFDNRGHLAATIQMAIAPHFPETYFTGIANVDFDEDNQPGGKSHIVVSCQDNWLSLMTEVYGLPFFDGWNAYYAAYFLAQLGGISKSRLNFLPYVPSDPYDPTPGDTPDVDGNYANTYFLPVGPAGTPITRFPGPQVKGEILLKIAKQIGFIAFFDQFAKLSFTKFIPPSPIPEFVLTDVATGSLSEMWGSMSYTGTLRDTRNAVTTLGIDPVTGMPIIGHAQDPNIWDDSLPTFKGFNDPLIWVDQSFVNPVYAGDAASTMLSYLKWPTRMMKATTWMPVQGFISPLTVIGVDDPRSGAHGKPFIVYGARYRRRLDEAPMASYAGRWFWGGQ